MHPCGLWLGRTVLLELDVGMDLSSRTEAVLFGRGSVLIRVSPRGNGRSSGTSAAGWETRTLCELEKLADREYSLCFCATAWVPSMSLVGAAAFKRLEIVTLH